LTLSGLLCMICSMAHTKSSQLKQSDAFEASAGAGDLSAMPREQRVEVRATLNDRRLEQVKLHLAKEGLGERILAAAV
jgi:hypothetical protein